MSRATLPFIACSAVLAASPAAAPALAQEAILLPELLISASQVPIAGRESGSAVTVITGEEMEDRGDVTVADALRGQPGLSVNTGGVRGAQTQVRIRGAEANHTLVLIDGVIANRAGTGDFDFAGVLATDIERVEVIRGPQSGIYGSNAHAGVINIITKSGRGMVGSALNARVEGGTQSSGLAHLGVRGGNGTVWVAGSASAATSDGFNISRFGSERDGFENFTGALRGGADFTDWLRVDGMLRMVSRNSEGDPEDQTDLSDPTDFMTFEPGPRFGMIIDGHQLTETEEALGRISAEIDLLDGMWTHRFSGTFNGLEYDFVDDREVAGGSKEVRRAASYQSTLRWDTPAFHDARHTLVGFADARRETYRNKVALDFVGAPPPEFQLAERQRDAVGLAGEYRVDFAERLALSGALRRDFNDGFEDATTWRLTGAYSVAETGTRFHSSIGKGVTNPTFIEQFGVFSAFVPNPDLVPEESIGWDAGIEQTLLDGKLVLDITYFQARLENEIAMVWTPDFMARTVENQQGTSRRRGVEFAAHWTPVDWLSISAAYTYTDSRNPDGSAEIRRPQNAARLDTTVRFDDGRGRFTTGLTYNGDMPDDWFSGIPSVTPVTLDDYLLVNASLAYQVTPEMEIYARAENLFDEDYEDIFSYQGSGFAAYAGLKLTLGAQ